MLTQELLVDIHVLQRQGKGIRAIARELGLSRNTVRKYLKNKAMQAQYQQRAPRPTKLCPFKTYIDERVQAAKPDWIPASVLFRELKEYGYEGGLSTVRNYLVQLKPQQKIEPLIRFETAPGEQMQVDFMTFNRGKTKLKAFVATLGFSRASFVHFSQFEREQDWLTGLKLAFEYFGGVPKKVLFDNAKCIMIERDAYGKGQHRWHSSILDLAKAYGFQPQACRPYRAKTKGKVERFNRYLKYSFLVPLAASLKQVGLDLDVETANGQIGQWLHEVAHQRVHGTTDQKPQVLLEQERSELMPLPIQILDLICRAGQLSPIPFESIQHPLQTYDQMFEVRL